MSTFIASLMSEIRRRIDLKKVQEIKDFLMRCNDALLSYENTMFAEYKEIRDATRLEHAAAHYPLFANDKKKSIKADVLKQYNAELREFNKSLKDMDIEIGGVEHEFEDLFGNKFVYVFMEPLYDIQAKKRSEREKKCAQGHMEKSKRLDEIATNSGLKKQHDMKMRAIRRLLDRKSKKE
jgi:hypothetical protein